MSKIKSIKAREILNSRGDWTIEVDLETSQGLFRDSAPSGVSKGKYEAKTVGSKIAVKNINSLAAPKLKGKNPANQKEIDDILKKLNIGADTTMAVSMAVARAGAAAQNIPLYKYIAKQSENRSQIALPNPCFNMINGGVHASSNHLDFQEFMVVPQFNKYSDNLKLASEIYQKLRKKLGKNVGDEGGFTPSLNNPETALGLLLHENTKIIIDVAASQFSDIAKKKYNLNYYQTLVKEYPIIGLEDPFAEDDFQSWQKFKPKDVLIIGDDLLVTNSERIKMAKEKNLCNAMILKINQIGTLTEALKSTELAKSYGWKIMVSHRSGETNDDFIADLAVGIGADYIKSGAPARGERVAKYNRLLRIEEELK